MIFDIAIICITMLAVVGLVHIISGIHIWLAHSIFLKNARLIVSINPNDEQVEATLIQAHSLVALYPAMRAITLEVHCQCSPASDNYQICAFFCIDNNIPFQHNW